MLLDDKEDKIELTTTNKHQITLDDKNENLEIKTKDGHFVLMDDKNTKITVQSKNGHINDSSDSENITIVDKDANHIFMIDISNEKLVIKTESGDIDLHAPEGTIDIQFMVKIGDDLYEDGGVSGNYLIDYDKWETMDDETVTVGIRFSSKKRYEV